MTAAFAACSLGVILPATAAARRLKLQPLRPGAASNIRLFRTPVPDRVRPTPLRTRAAARARAAASQTVFRTADGVSIPVAVSSSYAPDPAVEQSYVNLLGGLVHGSELSKIAVYIATPSQIRYTFCGEGALACYVGDEERIYVPGVGQNSDPPVEFLVAHEYGHHIELNRSNPPWSAFDQGTKYWATYENVCALERRHRVATNYYNDPSEAFAESYADMQYPGVDFIYTDLLAPDRAAFRAIRADVLRPWHDPRALTLRGSFGSGGATTRTFHVKSPLDGSATFDLIAPTGADYRLRVLAGNRTVRRTHSRGARSAATAYTVCGVRSLTLKITRAAGSGPFTVAASLP